MFVRAYAAPDFADLLAFLRTQPVALGQPAITGDMLREALAGRSPIDAGWWEDLSSHSVWLLHDGDTLVGACATGVSAAEGVGNLLWLATASADYASVLVKHADTVLSECVTQRAFAFATALGDGLEALPARLYPHVDLALREAGFIGEDMWLYMHRPLTDEDLSQTPGAAELVIEDLHPDVGQAWRLRTIEGDGLIEVGALPSGVAMVEWLYVADAPRGRGLGSRLLTAGFLHLRQQGAEQVILYVDHDAPGTDRDRTSAIALYIRHGFTVVDHLISYERRTTATVAG